MKGWLRDQAAPPNPWAAPHGCDSAHRKPQALQACPCRGCYLAECLKLCIPLNRESKAVEMEKYGLDSCDLTKVLVTAL